MDEQQLTPFFYEIFDASLPRLGPGDDASTSRALEIMLSARSQDHPKAPAELRILDIGCGNGVQTIQLARHVDGLITAVDNHQPFLYELERRARAQGVSSRIRTRLCDMRDLGAGTETFDVVWAEGSLYIMGFRKGLMLCHDLLLPRGLMAVTEICWFRPDPPEDCLRFFAEECPGMVDIDSNLTIIEGCGYEVLDHFVLPESAWWESYYLPLEGRLNILRPRYEAESEETSLIEIVQKEIDLYRACHDYYGYVFFVMRRM